MTPALSSAASARPAVQPNPRPLILVVEDETLYRLLLVDVLEEAGFSVIDAVHADEALQVLAAVPDIAAVVTDVEMPAGSLDGFELARRVRAEWNLGVLISSGRTIPHASDMPEGAFFVAKPVQPEVLVLLLKTLLARE